ncbi:MAG TPA: hypothetical protein DHW82_00465 [Spirochaetia bacterium]|nr:MAG: hypothetical protein A2Y41_07170 [Spirochaetes bacterium GWB1_36_13]HCL55472.1 hypothetical protein [Spirochaetia bacterium]
MPQLNSGFKDYYKILQVDPEADKEIIQKVYHLLMKKYHPDVSIQDDGKIIRELNQAYEILKDGKKRNDYDQEYQKYKKQSVIVHEVKSRPYLAEKNLLKEKEEELLAMKKELENQEFRLKIKLKVYEELKEQNKEFADLNSQKIEEASLMELFFNSSPEKPEFKKTLEAVKLLPDKRKTAFLLKIFESKKLTMEQEIGLGELVFEEKKEEFIPYLERFFKFKQFYKPLLTWILEKEIKNYLDKVGLLADNLSFQMGNNSELLPIFLEIYSKLFFKENLLQFLFKIQKLYENRDLNDINKETILLKMLILIQENNFKPFFKSFIKKLKKHYKNENFISDYSF